VPGHIFRIVSQARLANALLCVLASGAFRKPVRDPPLAKWRIPIHAMRVGYQGRHHQEPANQRERDDMVGLHEFASHRNRK
jgi:hypothetical protein